jgi:Ca-activated chloride channel family protein
MKLLLTIFILIISLNIMGQAKSASELIAEGNKSYKENQFAKAEEFYTKALTAEPTNAIAKFNIAAALYRQDKKVEAAQTFQQLADAAADKEIKAKAFYNKGVILSQQKNLEESIEAYKNALRNNPDDKEARENLQKALLELKKKNQSKKQNNKQNKKQEQPQPKPQQSKMKPKEAEQRLKLLQQKEKEVQQRVQKEKSKAGGSQTKDW